MLMIDIQGVFSTYIANKEKDNIDYEILSCKVDNMNFYDRYNTLQNYLNDLFEFGLEKTSIKNKSFLEDLLKGFKLKAVYTNKGEKAYDDLVWNNKKIDDVLYKKENNELSDKIRIFFRKQKSCLI